MTKDWAATSPQLPAGRELDALVAAKVFGYWDVQTFEGKLVHGEYNMNGWPVETPCYSTDIAAAWQVVEKMRERGAIGFALQSMRAGHVGCHAAFSEPDKPYSSAIRMTWAEADTYPLAICLAALKACDVLRAGAVHSDAVTDEDVERACETRYSEWNYRSVNYRDEQRKLMRCVLEDFVSRRSPTGRRDTHEGAAAPHAQGLSADGAASRDVNGAAPCPCVASHGVHCACFYAGLSCHHCHARSTPAGRRDGGGE